MNGKKIGILIAVLASLSMLVVPVSVSAVATHTLTATPSTAAWGDTEYISMAVSGAYWNGTAYCNLTDPNGNVVHLGGVALTGVTTAATLHYANWTYMPNIAGTWNVTVEFHKTSGSGSFATHYTSFDQERTMISVARDINAWSGVILYAIVGFLLIGMLVMLAMSVANKTGGRGGKVE